MGGACIVAGGLVAAVTSPAPSEHGTWAAAYLVLVAGVAQVTLGIGQALLAPRAPARRMVVTQMIAWNLSNAAVVTGTVAGVTPVVDAGGILLVVVLALLLTGVRGSGAQRWSVVTFRLLVVALLLSIPVGLALSRMRSS